MTSIISLKPLQQQAIQELHEDFGKKVTLTGCSTAAASFLIIGALIVISCGCLCLLLPGINAINHVIVPAVIPGLLAITVSIPLILLAVKHELDKNFYREQLINTMIAHLVEYNIHNEDEKIGVKFILNNFLNWKQSSDNPNKLAKNTSWTQEYQSKILGDIIDKIGTDKTQHNPRQKKIAEILEKARIKINKRK